MKLDIPELEISKGDYMNFFLSTLSLLSKYSNTSIERLSLIRNCYLLYKGTKLFSLT